MKITGTMSYIEVEIGEKRVKIEGEKTIGGFVADKETLTNWEFPYESEQIDELTKQRIIEKIINETQNSNCVITFE